MKTETILKRMLLENTGSNPLDSGGVGGRHWERNQSIDFDSEPKANIRFSVYNNKPDISVSLSLYHWLKERVEFEPELNKIFYREFLKERREKSWLELMDEFPEYLGQLLEPEEENNGRSFLRFGKSRNPFGGKGKSITINSYNGNNLLSQVIQATLFKNDMGTYAIIQIHGGCDVRGGYTRPKIFSYGFLGEDDILEFSNATIICSGNDRLPEAQEYIDNIRSQVINPIQTVIPGSNYDLRDILLEVDGCDHWWSTDDGCDWYPEGYSDTNYKKLNDRIAVSINDSEKISWKPGTVFIKNENGYCPYCGAKLVIK